MGKRNGTQEQKDQVVKEEIGEILGLFTFYSLTELKPCLSLVFRVFHQDEGIQSRLHNDSLLNTVFLLITEFTGIVVVLTVYINYSQNELSFCDEILLCEVMDQVVTLSNYERTIKDLGIRDKEVEGVCPILVIQKRSRPLNWKVFTVGTGSSRPIGDGRLPTRLLGSRRR